MEKIFMDNMAKLPELSKRMVPTMAEATRPTEEEIRMRPRPKLSQQHNRPT